MDLRPYQQAARQAVWDQWNQGVRSTLMVLPTGCHTPDQPILMDDGTTLPAASISTGDLLAGPDGTPRTVLRVHRGTASMKRIVPVKGDPFVVTEDHVLSLVRTPQAADGRYPSERGGQIVDVTVADWQAWPHHRQHIYKLYRAPYNFHRASAAMPLDPYTLGALLGDGSFRDNLSITTADKEVRNAVASGLAEFGLRLVGSKSNCGRATCWLIRATDRSQHSAVRFRRTVLRPLGLDRTLSGTKSVPTAYRYGPRHARLAVLAGLMDTDGYRTCGGYEYVSKSYYLAMDVVFMARSVGLAAYATDTKKECQTGTRAHYHRVMVSGDTSIIPVRVPYKRQQPRRQKKSVLRTGFTVEDAGVGPYVGFTVDGDNRYLLGDFTVTHNCGKTIVFSAIINDAVAAGGRVLVLAHREELLAQAADKLARVTGLGCAVEKAESTAADTWFNVTVGSVQTLCRENRRGGQYTHIIVDEAHHAVSPSYRAVIDHWRDAKVLGVTATADRGDKRNLGEVFETLAYEYTLPAAIRQGYLCPIRALTIPLKIDVSGVSITAGDLAAAGIGSALDPYLEQIADHVAEQTATRKTVVFLPLIATSQKFLRLLELRGIEAREVNGESADRAQVLDWFQRAGPGAVVCNAMLLTEGWDCPSADCICVLRPTKIRSLYAQMVGRGTRVHPGKQDLLLLDFLWHSERHELCRPAHLVCQDQDISRRVAELLAEESEDKAVDLLDAEAGAEGKAQQEREAKLAELLAAQRHRKRALVDPLQYEYSVGQTEYAPDSADLRAMGPPSAAQLKRLEDAGIFPDEVTCQGHATRLLDTLAKRRLEGLATPKQIRKLESFGFKQVGTWQYEAASGMITRIAAGMWRVPRGVDPATYAPPTPATVGGAAW